MWLWYSWQSAAVVNEHGDVLDAEFNNARFSVHAVKERLELFGLVKNLKVFFFFLSSRFPFRPRATSLLLPLAPELLAFF